uniref:DUF2779 domain-containing protein n=1 Tax=uncultured archaeon MedDCM-OCT-S02-C115 TaxID=743083 RepID=D6PB03_9ARCH|nr:conserved hypothetical protein [uncultured archaeon MedDCM-OCT-S02-C115]
MKYAFVKSFAANCHLLAFNLSKDKTPPSYSQQALFAAGNDVDAIALETILKPYHTMMATSTPHGDWLATQSAIANGIAKINQATFKVGETYIRVDSIDLECMKLTEVKAGSSVKDDYIIDLALQEFFLRQVGMRNDKFSLILREKSFVTGSPWNEALREVDVTSDVKSLLEQDDFIHFVEVFEAGYDSAPQPVFGKVCKTCDFKGQCWSELEHPSFTIPRSSDKLLAHIISNEAYELSTVSSSVLTQNQISYKDSTLNSEISISKSGLIADLNQFTGPIAHLDFEAFNLPYNPSKNTKTFEMVPFQASIHLEGVDGSISHFEHLCSHQYDDRESLAAFLVANLAVANTIVTWNVSFEDECSSTLLALFQSIQRTLAT